ncbi:SRPBCC domain-containing protein [Streptomyces sp. CA-294286]|uniref:SRPBCC domain-containing protein n=1 Tax=Streptomyces sp. CA-294286 TaxID=3240070 RepID=UPI003D941E28
MEHEVFVPVLPEAVRQTLADPARVARCVPGLQQDADKTSPPLSGRMKVRVGGHTITYRGTLGITAADEPGAYSVEGEGTEARGNGAVKLALTVRTEETGEAPDRGTTLFFTGTAHGDGRIAELDVPAVEAAVHRLLDRFAARLGTEATDLTEPAASTGPAAPAGPAAPGPSPDEADAQPPSLDRLGGEELSFDDPLPGTGAGARPAPDTDALREDEDEALRAALEGIPGELPDAFPEEPPAEAAHARRTMIGRSAEEVDHAPPRGRYAPVMAPAPASGPYTLRRLAPAAALAVASAVVVGRVLRRRK